MPGTVTDIIDLDTDTESPEEETGHHSYVTKHVVFTDRAQDPMTAVQLRADPSIPVPHLTRLATDTAAVCRTRKFRASEDPHVVFMDVKWSTARDDDERESDPYTRPVRGSVRCIDKEVPIFFDAQGRPLVTTAGELYGGQTAVTNVEVFEVVAFSQQFPYYLSRLNNTVNSTAVTIFGEVRAPRTCWMKNLRLPDEPNEEYGKPFYETRFEVHYDSAGIFSLLPNAGMQYLEYYTRTEKAPGPPRTFNTWVRSSYAAYTGEADSDLKKVEIERASSHSGSTMPGKVWLDVNGEKVLPDFSTSTPVTGSMTAGSKILTLSAGVLTPDHVGTVVTAKHQSTAGSNSAKPSVTYDYIVSVDGSSSGTQCTLTHAAAGDFSGVPIGLVGKSALFNYFEKQPAADWNDATYFVPLPPTPPTLSELP